MKKTRLVLLAIGLSVALAGCFKAEATAEFIGAVQAHTAKLCKFVPLAGTIGAIVGTMEPTLLGSVVAAKAVADKVCAAVSPQTQALMKTMPTVNGVPVEGYWIE